MQNIVSLRQAPIRLGSGDPNNLLPGTGASGPRGIEAVIEYNGLYMNVRNWIDTYLVTNIGGLDDADVRDNRELNPGYHGETASKGLYGGRTVTLSGKIETRTLFKLRDMQQALRMAFAQLDEDLPLIFRAPVPELDMQIFCRKSSAIQMADEQRTANHFERAFMITLRASNPRWTGSVRLWEEFHFPGATFDAIALTRHNNGNLAAQPILELDGPMTNLILVNENNGAWVSIPNVIPTGQTWVLDTAARRFYNQADEANRFQYLDLNSDWMEYAPGVNSIRATASGLTGVSRITSYHRHTWI